MVSTLFGGWTYKMATRGCPCGYFGSDRQCRCTPAQVAAYATRVSGPLRDRIDLSLVVPPVPVNALQDSAPGESSAEVRARVARARRVQSERAEGTGVLVNAGLRGAELMRWCRPDVRGKARLARGVEVLGLSARGYHRVLKVARTIADLEGSTAVAADHIAEALQFRGS